MNIILESAENGTQQRCVATLRWPSGAVQRHALTPWGTPGVAQQYLRQANQARLTELQTIDQLIEQVRAGPRGAR